MALGPNSRLSAKGHHLFSVLDIRRRGEAAASVLCFISRETGRDKRGVAVIDTYFTALNLSNKAPSEEIINLGRHINSNPLL